MMGEVINISADAPLVWVCECGCSTFHMMSDSSAECSACEKAHDGIGNGWIDRDRRSSVPPGDVFADTQGNGSVEFARLRVAKMASDDNVRALIVAREDGSISTWTAAEDAAQVAWVVEKVHQACDLMARKMREK
jgi:hypothetical protein